MLIRYALLAVLTVMLTASAAFMPVTVELRGSPASMERQHAVAVEQGLTFARTFDDIDRMVEEGELVRLEGNAYYDLREGLRSDAARPEARLFIERLAKEYFENTGEKLVVTSLIRPASSQPSNSHSKSVHPTGIAIDLRVSQRAESRQWLEAHLLEKEMANLLDVTREFHPPHYHLAIFPDEYLAHLEAELGAEALEAALNGEELVAEMDEVIIEADAIGTRSLWSLITSLFSRG